MKNERTVREGLVLWLAFNSQVTDFKVRAFAEQVCLNFDVDKGATTFTLHEFAKRYGISLGSVHKYTHQLIASGEWTITPQQGVSTAYVPNFLDEAKKLSVKG